MCLLWHGKKSRNLLPLQSRGIVDGEKPLRPTVAGQYTYNLQNVFY